MRLYGVTISAARDKGGERPEVCVQNGVVLLFDYQSIDDEGLSRARELFSEADGWADHQIVHTEIEQGYVFAGRYRLTWQTEEVVELIDA